MLEVSLVVTQQPRWSIYPLASAVVCVVGPW